MMNETATQWKEEQKMSDTLYNLEEIFKPTPKPEPPKPYIYDGKEITKEWFAQAVKGSRKIQLIKLCRTLSGWGLKEAKNGVENNCCSPNPNHPNHPVFAPPLNLDKTIAYFSQWLATPEQLKALKAEQTATDKEIEEHQAEALKIKDANETAQILNGLNAACMDWKYLGYKNKYDACRMVLSNYQAIAEGD